MKDDNNVVLDSMTIRLMKTYHPERLAQLQAQVEEAKGTIKKALKSSDSSISSLVDGYSVGEIVQLAKSFDTEVFKEGLTSILERNLLVKNK